MQSNKQSTRRRFTHEEDNLLKELAKDKKNKTWEEIAQYLPGRTACQCRDRYNQYLYTNVVSKPWTKEEDETIMQKYKEFGPHWVKIALYLPGRSGTNIKNRWNTTLIKYHGNSKVSKRHRCVHPPKVQEKGILGSDPLFIDELIHEFTDKSLNDIGLDSFLKV